MVAKCVIAHKKSRRQFVCGDCVLEARIGAVKAPNHFIATNLVDLQLWEAKFAELSRSLRFE